METEKIIKKSRELIGQILIATLYQLFEGAAFQEEEEEIRKEREAGLISPEQANNQILFLHELWGTRQKQWEEFIKGQGNKSETTRRNRKH